MRGRDKISNNPEIDISFTKHNKDMSRQESRLNVEIIRVHTIQKNRALKVVWSLNQQQLCNYLTKYELFPQDYMSIQQLLESSKLKLIKSDGKIYFGEVNHKRREGKGIYLQNDGKIYEGYFYNNQKSNRGIEIYPNGNLYIGEFLNNKKHNFGIFYWFNLSSRTPKSDEFVEYYEGQWWGGLPDGKGTHQKISGDLFTGGFKNGLKHGEGVQYYGNGDYYKGEFVNGMPQGYGQYIWAEGGFYKGDFKQGQRNGYGLWQASKNRSQCYKGHFSNDKKTGYGVYQWDNGWIYKGNFDNDYRNGYGELYNSEGQLMFQGCWENGNQTDKQVIGRQKEANFKISRYIRSGSSKNGHNTDRRDQAGGNIRSTSGISVNRKDIGEYATISNFGEFNLCKRPERPSNNAHKNIKSFSELKGIRFKQNGVIGTPINRPLLGSSQLVNSQQLKKYSSAKKY